ncbi:MAG: hypothetical protein ACQCN5_12800 [Candidatus Bathyarchaeia archaeon]
MILVFSTTLSLLALVTTPAFADSLTEPSVPEFTVIFVDSSYDVLTTYTTDPYTGENVTQPGYHVQNRTIEVTIINQPFTPYQDNGQTIKLYLNIRTRGAYAENWTTIYNPDSGFLTPSNGEYTKVSYSLDDNKFPFWDNLPQGGTVEFQVEALKGYVYRTEEFAKWCFEGEESGWSNTKTVEVPTTAGPSPSVPEFPLWVAPALFAATSLAAFTLRKQKAPKKRT